MAGQWTPVDPHTYLVAGANLIIAGCPVIQTTTANTVDIPTGAATDHLVGVALEDAGTGALLGQDATKPDIAVQVFGTAKMYGKSGITAGDYVKVASGSISVTPPGYASAVAVWPVTTAARAAAGAQPAAIMGRAQNATSADGDIVFVDLLPGATY